MKISLQTNISSILQLLCLCEEMASRLSVLYTGEVGDRAVANGADAGPSDTELLLLLNEVRLGGEPPYPVCPRPAVTQSPDAPQVDTKGDSGHARCFADC